MTFRLRFHPPVAHNLDAIAQWIVDRDEPDIAAQKLAEIEAAVATLRDTPQREASAMRSPPDFGPSLPGGKLSSRSWWTTKPLRC
nr:type II toxin-antitoxin system RelE/ParE family toxin [Paracoccus binzhouensis]